MWYAPEKFARKVSKTKTRNRDWFRNPKNRPLIRHWHLKREFGISHEEYEALLKTQGGVCAICKQPEKTKFHRHLAVDHCHVTKRIRGLLCRSCNVAIGNMEEIPDRLIAAANYLRSSLGMKDCQTLSAAR